VNLTIRPAELRGVASRGMICSLQELGLADSDGIAILDDLLEQVPALGQPVGPALGLDDQVLELAITANRPDGLSMRGIAREVAALIGGSTTFPAPSRGDPPPAPARLRRRPELPWSGRPVQCHRAHGASGYLPPHAGCGAAWRGPAFGRSTTWWTSPTW
jgi:hypothetical protein